MLSQLGEYYVEIQSVVVGKLGFFEPSTSHRYANKITKYIIFSYSVLSVYFALMMRNAPLLYLLNARSITFSLHL